MQLGNLVTTGALMQAIDVLGYGASQSTQLLEARQGMVCLVWLGPVKSLPADIGTRPVRLPGLVAIDKITILHRLLLFPVTIFVSVVRNSGGGTNPGPGKNEDTFMASEKFGQQRGHAG